MDEVEVFAFIGKEEVFSFEQLEPIDGALCDGGGGFFVRRLRGWTQIVLGVWKSASICGICGRRLWVGGERAGVEVVYYPKLEDCEDRGAGSAALDAVVFIKGEPADER